MQSRLFLSVSYTYEIYEHFLNHFIKDVIKKKLIYDNFFDRTNVSTIHKKVPFFKHLSTKLIIFPLRYVVSVPVSGLFYFPFPLSNEEKN